jgi:hypothetical protein
MTLLRGRTREVYRVYDAEEFLWLDELPIPSEADHTRVPRAASVARPPAAKLGRRLASAAALTGVAGAICWLVAIGVQRSTRGTALRRPGTRSQATVSNPARDLVAAAPDQSDGARRASHAARSGPTPVVRIRRRKHTRRTRGQHSARGRSHGARRRSRRAVPLALKAQRPAVRHDEFGFERVGPS